MPFLIKKRGKFRFYLFLVRFILERGFSGPDIGYQDQISCARLLKNGNNFLLLFWKYFPKCIFIFKMNSKYHNISLRKMYFWNQPTFWTYSCPYSYPSTPLNQNQLFYPGISISLSQNHPQISSDSMDHPDAILPNPLPSHSQPQPIHAQNRKTNKKTKELKQGQETAIKVSRNTKSLIIRQFLRFINKDASKILQVKEITKCELPIKEFLSILNKQLKKSKQKYIRISSLRELCYNKEEEEFSLILRITLKNFLSTEFQLQVLCKKKNKAEYLKGKRELLNKVFGKNIRSQDEENQDL